MNTLPNNPYLTDAVKARIHYRRGPAEVRASIDYILAEDANVVHLCINGKTGYRKFDADLSLGHAADELGHLVNDLIDELWPLELVPS